MTHRWKRWFCLAWLLLISGTVNCATPMIYAGSQSSLYLNNDGTVWGTGAVTGYWPGALSPVRVLELANVIAVTAAGGSDLALLADGTLWGSGNFQGLLADGTIEYRSQPQRVPGLTDIKQVAAGDFSHVFVLKNDGTVWSWGKNEYGQLGDGTKTDRFVPAPVVGLTNVVKISASGWGGLALKSDGTVWVWGWTCCGAAGNGTEPAGHGDPDSYRLVPTQVPGLDQVVAVAAGLNHHMALRADGTVWTWGYGESGQNGTGSFSHQLVPVPVPGLDQVVAIEAKGSYYSLALRADGTVWGWGNNASGQLGVSGITYSTVPIQVPDVTDVVAISAGPSHVVALRRDGTAWAWGSNLNAQLGDNTFEDRTLPGPVIGPGASGQLNLVQPAPSSYNLLPSGQISLNVASGTAPLTVQATAINAHDPDGTVTAFSWKSSNGQVANGGSAIFVFAQAGTHDIDLVVHDNAGGRGSVRRQVVVAPAPVGGVSTDPKVRMSLGGSVALTSRGRVLLWGHIGLGHYDNEFQFSLPDKLTYPIANGLTGAVDVAIGSHGTVHVLLADGSVLGWGANNFGEVGSGTTAFGVSNPQVLPNLPPVQALAGKANNYLALTRDGRIFSWGSNTFGELGLGDYENRFAPVEITGLDNVTAIATGYNLSVALKADGSVWAWGRNNAYTLGDGTQISRNRPIQIPGLSNITKIFVANITVFALKADGTVWVTGYLPTPIPGDPGAEPGARHVSAYDGVVQITGEFSHVIALKPDGTVWTGGQQSSLALGIETNEDIVGLRQLPGISDAIWVAATDKHSMVVRRDGTVLAWGSNHWGHVGDGTLARQLTPVLVVNETIDGPLDLVPEVANNIPQNLIPPFFVATYSYGALSATTIFVDLRGITPSGVLTATNRSENDLPRVLATASGVGTLAAGNYNVYVAAAIPYDGSQYYFQLESSNAWSVLNWPMADFMRGVELGSQDALIRVNILQNVDLSPYIGTSILVGYGTDPDEMVTNARYRTIFTVTPQQ